MVGWHSDCLAIHQLVTLASISGVEYETNVYACSELLWNACVNAYKSLSLPNPTGITYLLNHREVYVRGTHSQSRYLCGVLSPQPCHFTNQNDLDFPI